MNKIPAWAIERVHLEAYDTSWPQLAATFSDELEAILRPWLIKDIEHVGSTSIPGLSAKPIIDLMALVENKDEVAQSAVLQLKKINWEHVPPALDDRPWRQFFVKVSTDKKHRLAHLHLMAEGTERWDEQLLFRDRLRTDQKLKKQYGELKKALAIKFADDREKYTMAKTDFIRNVLKDSAS